MNKKKLHSIAFVMVFCAIASPAFAQNQVIRMTTAKSVGSTMTLLVNSTREGVSVDWGDGNIMNYSGGEEPLTEITGTLQGTDVTITAGEKLTVLACPGNELTNLDVSAAPELRSLYCQNNSLSELSLSALKKLKDLNVANNQLSRFSVSTATNPLIETLSVANNNLSGDFVLRNSCLLYVDASNNAYTRLYVTSNPNLDVLKCSNNKITSLILTANASMSTLVAHNNQLSSVSINANEGLAGMQQIIADNNNLSTLDLSKSANLNTVSVRSNNLSLVQLPSSKLQVYDCGENSLGFNSLPATKNMPENFSYTPQSDFEITSGLPTVWGYDFPYVQVCPSYSDRTKSEYILDLSAVRVDANNKAITFEWYSVDSDGVETQLVRATATNREQDYTETSGKFTFLKTFDNVYGRLSSTNYPDLVVYTKHLSVFDQQSVGIGNAPTESGLETSTADGALVLSSQTAIAVQVYSAAGKLVWKGQVNAVGERVNLPKGVYIVNGKKVIV